MKPLYWFLAALVLFAAGAGLISVRGGRGDTATSYART